MAFKPKAAKQNNTKYVPQPALEAGTYPARLWSVVTLGLQKQRPYKGEEKAPVEEFSITYELLDEYMVDEEGNEIEDKPRVVGEIIPFYSHTAEKSNAAKRYLALDPNAVHDGDWSALVGEPCMVTISLKPKNDGTGGVWTNVVSISAMRERDAKKARDLINPPQLFDFDDPDLEVYEKLPQFLRDKIAGSLRFEGSAIEAALNGGVKKEPNPAPKQEPKVEQEEGEGDDLPW